MTKIEYRTIITQICGTVNLFMTKKKKAALNYA
jgi:hypothetical protein